MKRFVLVICLFLGTVTQAFSADTLYDGVKLALIVDVRTVDEYAADHVDGAVNIPLPQIVSGMAQQKGIAKNSRILVYCRSGKRAAAAMQALNTAGYSNVINGGGLLEVRSKLVTCTKRAC